MTQLLPPLSSERLRFRAHHPADAEALFPSFSDAEFMRHWSRPPLGSIEEMRGYLGRVILRVEDGLIVEIVSYRPDLCAAFDLPPLLT